MLHTKRLIQLASLLLITGIVAHVVLMGLISDQQEQNIYLIAQLTQQKMEIGVLQQKQQTFRHLDAQLHFIITLHNNNFQIVEGVRQLIKTVPATISLNEIKLNNKNITINGSALSDLDIVNFMGNIAKIGLFDQPVVTMLNTSSTARYFQLKVYRHE